MAFKFWILDKDEKIVAVASNRGAALPIFHFEEKEQLNGEYNVTFRVPANHEDAKYIIEGNYILVKDVDDKFQQFKIAETRTTHGEENVIEALAEHLRCELYDYVIDKYEADEQPISVILTHILKDTRWDVGMINNDKEASMTFYMRNVLQCIHDIANEVGGELRFRVEFVGNEVIGRYVDVLFPRGKDTGKRFEYGKDITSIVRTVDDSAVATALIGLGKTTDVQLANGENERLTFAEVEWDTDNGDPADKPLGQIWIGDEAARQNFGIPDGNGGRIHRMQVVEFHDVEDPVELLQKTHEALPRYTTPRVTYDANVVDLENALGYPHESVRLGDTVAVINRDFTPELRIKARVVEIQRDRLHPENSRVILGNFIDLFSDRDEINAIKDRSRAWEGALKPGDRLKTSWLDGIIDAIQTEIRAGAGKIRITRDGILQLNREPENNPTKAILLNEDIIAVSNTRVPEEDPATPAGWVFRNAVTGDGIIADAIASGTLNASLVDIITENDDGTSRVRIFDGNIFAYENELITMRLGGYRWQFYDNNGDSLGFFGITYRPEDPESRRGMSWIGTKSIISIDKFADGEARSFFDADLDNNILYISGGWSGGEEKSARVTLYADEWVWGSGIYRNSDQPTIRLLRESTGSQVLVYYGDSYSDNSTSRFEIRENYGSNTYLPMITCQDKKITLYPRTYLGEDRMGWVEGSNLSVRLGAGDGIDNCIQIYNDGTIFFWQNGSVSNGFRADGSKIGGTIKIDGKNWGMSPIDSPQHLIEYIIFDQDVNEEGVVVELDPKYAKAVENYAVFPNRGDVSVVDKTPTSFVVKGAEGNVSLRIVGIRKGYYDVFWTDMQQEFEVKKNKNVRMWASNSDVVKPPVLEAPQLPERKMRGKVKDE